MLINKSRSVYNSNRSFLTGDLIWGVKQQQTLSPKQHFLTNKIRKEFTQTRHLSENPSTYLR